MIEQAQEILGYTFRDPLLLEEAFTHASIAATRLNSNERMEFLGDAVLGMVVCHFIYERFADLMEGELTKIKSAVVSRRTCAMVSEKLNLVGLLNVGKGMGLHHELPSSLAAGVYESVIGAIYLDGGLEAARNFILRDLEPLICQMADSDHQHNFKSLLQQTAQRRTTGVPVYMVLDEKGPDHAKCFEVCVEISGRRFGSAWAANKKQAEQKAALSALCEMHLAHVDEHGQVQIHEDAIL